MEAFAERARVELEATGEHARKRTVETRDDHGTADGAGREDLTVGKLAQLAGGLGARLDIRVEVAPRARVAIPEAAVPGTAVT